MNCISETSEQDLYDFFKLIYEIWKSEKSTNNSKTNHSK